MNKALKQFELSTNNDFDLIKISIASIVNCPKEKK